MKFRLRIAALALLASAGLAGCEPPPPRSVHMSLDAVNTADKILVLEGETDLPPGSRLVAQMETKDGQVVARDESVVRDSSFFFDFDMQRLSEFSSYRVLVTFDPEKAPLGVRLRTGLWGEALQGAGVRERDKHKIFSTEKEIVLSASAKGKEWEGRDFEEMEGAERSRLISAMERFLEEKPDDKSVKLALARAYIAEEPKEFSEGSRAHLLLTDVARSTETNRDGQTARELLDEIETADKKKQQRVATQKAMAEGDRYRRDFTIAAGKNLGGFRMGTPYHVAGRYFKMDRRLNFNDPDESTTVKLLDFNDIELTYDPNTRRLVAARTTSPKFKLPEGLGVGSLLQELQRAYGVEAIPTPQFQPSGSRPDGTKLYTGMVIADGLGFEIQREVDAVVGIPVDKVTAVTVFQQ